MMRSSAFPHQWQNIFSRLQQIFFDIPQEMYAESAVRSHLNDSLAKLSLLSQKALNLSFSTDDFIQYVSGSLEGIPAGKGMYLGSGVTIASLQPMRPVPFRLVYILGLSENEFPGKR